MSEIIAGPPTPACYHLFPRLGVGESQRVRRDRYLSRAHAREVIQNGACGQIRGVVTQPLFESRC